MKIAFAGFRHGHIYSLYKMVSKRNDFTVVACFESDDAARQAAQMKIGASFIECTYDELLKRDFDVLAIGARYGERGEMILKALKKGKHVIADKPICTSESELDEICKELKKGKNKLGCMLDLRYMPSTAAAKKALGEYELGEVRNISFSGQHCIDYNNRPKWYFEKGMHGGTINDLAIHGIDLVTHLTGLTVDKVNAARMWNSYAYQNPDFKDCAIFMAQMNNGAGLLADVSYSAPTQVFSMPTYWNFKIWCACGMVTFCVTDNNAYIYKEGVKERITVNAPDITQSCLDDLLLDISGKGDLQTKFSLQQKLPLKFKSFRSNYVKQQKSIKSLL